MSETSSPGGWRKAEPVSRFDGSCRFVERAVEGHVGLEEVDIMNPWGVRVCWRMNSAERTPRKLALVNGSGISAAA